MTADAERAELLRKLWSGYGPDGERIEGPPDRD